MKTKTSNILGTNEHEFTTELVFQAGDSFYYERRNGGQRGAYPKGSGPATVKGPQQISRADALAQLASWGYDEVELSDPV